jgi:hypothetical protein
MKEKKAGALYNMALHWQAYICTIFAQDNAQSHNKVKIYSNNSCSHGKKYVN